MHRKSHNNKLQMIPRIGFAICYLQSCDLL